VDPVRYAPAGQIEFLGRLDHQVKIRGFRIELGEIEAALKAHGRVEDALVTVYEEGEKQLLAYVISPLSEIEQTEARASHIGHWQSLYESTYGQSPTSSSDFDITGWESSYTGEAIPPEQMAIWVEETVAQLRRLHPQQVVEIGCGSGLLLTRLAADCETYVGLDFSEKVLAQLGNYISTREDLSHVMLRPGLAHELSFLADDSVDLV